MAKGRAAGAPGSFEGNGQVMGQDDPVTRTDYFWRRYASLKAERSSWDAHARELAQYLMPRASRFTTSDTNKGAPKHNKIFDNTGLRDVRILAAGLMSGLTSPARPWFKLKHSDDELMAYEPVKVWCSQTTKVLLDVFAKSNTYRTLHQGYTEIGVFGTTANLVMPHAKKVIHSTPMTWGEYALATNEDGVVDTLYRELRMTAYQMCRQFGFEALSPAAQAAYTRGALDTWFEVIHAIEPNLASDPGLLDQRNMPFRSVYFEQGAIKGKFLRESGFRRFRALAPRWQVTGQDFYGESPGMEALGDVKQLQHEQLRKAQAIDYMTRPPIGLPLAAKGGEHDLAPGGVSYLDGVQGTMGQRQMFDVKLDLNHLLEDIQDVRGRVHSAFYADLFMMIANMEESGQKMTATEVAERHEEKLLMLGPVLERLQNEYIEPLVDMTFDQLVATSMLPPPPPELQGQPLNVELIGILAQAQRAVATNGLDRFFTSVGQVAQMTGDVSVFDKVDRDQAVEAYADGLAIDPRILVDDDKVAQTRQARAQQQQAAMQSAQGSAVADGAAKLAKVPTQGGASNAGADVIGMFSGYGNPQAERVLPGT